MVRLEVLDHRLISVAAPIHAVQKAAYAQEARLLQVSHFPPLEQTVEDIMAYRGLCIGAMDGEALIGVALVGPNETNTSQNLDSLVVMPSRQRAGVGKALVAAALAQFGTWPLTVETAAKNLPALALYAQFRFVQEGRGLVGSESLELVRLRR